MKPATANKAAVLFGHGLARNGAFCVSVAIALVFSVGANLLVPRTALAIGEAGWEKYGPAVLPKGSTGSWDEIAAGEVTVIDDRKDRGYYYMWYSGGDKDNVFRIGVARSTDGLQWEKNAGAVMEPGPASWDSKGVASPMVIKDGSTYKMWYAGRDAEDVLRIGYATSTDRVKWTKSGNTPVLAIDREWEADGVGAPAVIREDAQSYKMWYSGRKGSRAGVGEMAIGYAYSTDGISWVKSSLNPVLTAGAPGSWDGRGVGVPSVIKESNVYKMWYTGYLTTGATISSHIGYAYSADGISWNRHRDNPIIHPGLTNSWDGRGVGAPSVLIDDRVYKMWYSGLDTNLAARTGFASIPNYLAQTTAVQFQRPADLVIVVKHGITAISSSGPSQSPLGGIASYTAHATYNSSGIAILGIIGMPPFDNAGLVPTTMGVTYTASQSGAEPEPPLDVAYLVPRLVGDKDTPFDLTLTFDLLVSGGSVPFSQVADAVLSGIRRGDARQDSNNNVSIIDALFIAQYLARIRPISDLNPINAASVRYDGDDGDRITIQDAMFIAQMLAQIRDASYNLR